jgi:hypothetical protein
MVKKFAGYLKAELIGAESSSNNLAIYDDDEEHLKQLLLTFKGFLEGLVGIDKVRVTIQTTRNPSTVDKLV